MGCVSYMARSVRSFGISPSIPTLHRRCGFATLTSQTAPQAPNLDCSRLLTAAPNKYVAFAVGGAPLVIWLTFGGVTGAARCKGDKGRWTAMRPLARPSDAGARPPKGLETLEDGK